MYASFIEQEGFATFPCAGLDAMEVLSYVKRFDFSWLNKTNLNFALQNQITAIETWKPAAVLGDTMPTLNMAAEKTGVPCISLMNGYMSKQYAGVRNMSWRYPMYKFLSFLPAPVLDHLTKEGEHLSFHKIHQPFKELRQRYGLSKKSYYPDELEGDLNLICDLPELFPQQPLPENYVLTPPLLYESSTTSEALVNKLDPDKKTLFVSMGSTGDWEQASFLNRAPFQKYNIVTAGDVNGIVQGQQVIRTAFASPEPLFRQVDLVLCHGGNGTVYQALRYGIPLLCKTAHFEQEWNVQALQKAQLGASLDGVKNSADYQKRIEAWIDKKGSAPLQFIQQTLAATIDFTPVITRILEQLPSETQTLYFDLDRKSA